MQAIRDPRPIDLVGPRTAAHDLAELLAFGTQFVEIVSDEDLAGCPACRAMVGRILPAMIAPLPPIDGCAGACGCQLAPISLE
jgi:hypothetical protein